MILFLRNLYEKEIKYRKSFNLNHCNIIIRIRIVLLFHNIYVKHKEKTHGRDKNDIS